MATEPLSLWLAESLQARMPGHPDGSWTLRRACLGAILDRLDLEIEVPALPADALMDSGPGEPSAVVRARVFAARAIQHGRGGLDARLPSSRLERVRALDAAGWRLASDAVDRGGMSARGVHRALRVAHTIADLTAEARLTATRVA